MSRTESSLQNSPAYTALYRRWRPQLFSQVVGQKHVTRTLQNALSSGRVAHAYLFCGLRGTGKTTMAKLLARALNCQEGVHPEPCNSCPSCLEIMEGRSMDVQEIDAASNRGIDEIRDLRDKARYTTAQSRYKVYIVDEVHMLTNEAFNALLKILEEPPPNVVFILATTEVYKLPLTVVSRCQRFDFHLLGSDEIAAHLQSIAATLDFALDSTTLYLLARQAEGSMRDALGFLEQCRAYGGEKLSYSEAREILGLAAPETIFDLLEAVVQEDTGRGLAALGALVCEGRDLHRFIRELILYLRKLVVLQSGENEKKILADVPGLKPHLLQHKGKFDNAVLLEMLEILQELTFQLRSSSQPQFLLELTFLRLLRVYRFRQYFSPGALFQYLEALEEKLQASGQTLAPVPGREQEPRLAARQPVLPDMPAGPVQGTAVPQTAAAAQTAAASGKPAKQAAATGKTTKTDKPEGTAEAGAADQRRQDPPRAVKDEETRPGEQPQDSLRAVQTEETQFDGQQQDPSQAMPAEETLPFTARTSASAETAPWDDPDLADTSPGRPDFAAASPARPDFAASPPGHSDPAAAVSTHPNFMADPPSELLPDDSQPGFLAGDPPPEAPSAPPQAGFRMLEGPQLQQFWEAELLPALKKQHRHVLHALMLEAVPLSCKEGVFVLTFPPTHSIHKDRVESSRHRKHFEALLSSLLGTKTVFRVILQENKKEKKKARDTAGDAGSIAEPPSRAGINETAGRREEIDATEKTFSPTATGSTNTAAPASPGVTAPPATEEKASRSKQEDDYYMQQMVDLFKGKLLAAGKENMESRDFWRPGASLPPEK